MFEQKLANARSKNRASSDRGQDRFSSIERAD